MIFHEGISTAEFFRFFKNLNFIVYCGWTFWIRWMILQVPIRFWNQQIQCTLYLLWNWNSFFHGPKTWPKEYKKMLQHWLISKRNLPFLIWGRVECATQCQCYWLEIRYVALGRSAITKKIIIIIIIVQLAKPV